MKFVDDGGTIKAIDDVKQPQRDKQFSDQKLPGQDGGPFGAGFGPASPPQAARAGAGARPFVLSTPHHSMAWAQGGATAGSPATSEMIAQYEAAITQLAQLIQQRADELQRLDQMYQQALEEYRTLVQGRRY